MSITALLRHSHSDDSHEREVARRELESSLRDEPLVLLQELECGEVEIRRAAADAITLIDSLEIQSQLIKRAIADSDPYVIAYGCWSTECLGDATINLWEQVADLFGHTNWHVRQAALTAMLFCDAASATKLEAMAKAVTDSEWQVRAEVAEVIVRIAEWNLVSESYIAMLLEDAEREVRKATARSLTQADLGLMFLKRVLFVTLKDDDIDVKLAGCEIATKNSPKCAFAVSLLAGIAKCTDPELRDSAIKAVAAINEHK